MFLTIYTHRVNPCTAFLFRVIPEASVWRKYNNIQRLKVPCSY